MQELIIQKYNFVKGKIKFITNGFDFESPCNLKKDFSAFKGAPGKRLNITFIGNVYSGMMFEICEALKELKAENNELSSQIIIKIVGLMPEQEKRLLEEQDIKDLVDYRGFVSYSHISSYIENADVLLVLFPRNLKYKGWIPSKIFSYISAGKPILALVPEGDARDILGKTRTGVCVKPDNIPGIKMEIKNLLKDFADRGLKFAPDWEEIGKYDRKKLTNDLAEIFNKVLR
jgi:hypothetical protein